VPQFEKYRRRHLLPQNEPRSSHGSQDGPRQNRSSVFTCCSQCVCISGGVKAVTGAQVDGVWAAQGGPEGGESGGNVSNAAFLNSCYSYSSVHRIRVLYSALLKEAAEDAGLLVCVVRDAGHTQVPSGSVTVLSIGPGMCQQ